jgi:hypothetical protein
MAKGQSHASIFLTKTKLHNTELKLNNILLSQIDSQSPSKLNRWPTPDSPIWFVN